MSFLPASAPNASLLEVFKFFPETACPLILFHERLMRGDSPLTLGQRELIAAYVSGLNACAFCHGVHQATAQALGVEEGLLSALLRDLESAPVAPALRPLLRYAHQLTLNPGRITRADAEAVFAAGWNERALHDAVCVCALFNLMNRLVNGLGVTADTGHYERAGQRLARHGYAGLLNELPEPR